MPAGQEDTEVGRAGACALEVFEEGQAVDADTFGAECVADSFGIAAFATFGSDIEKGRVDTVVIVPALEPRTKSAGPYSTSQELAAPFSVQVKSAELVLMLVICISLTPSQSGIR